MIEENIVKIANIFGLEIRRIKTYEDTSQYGEQEIIKNTLAKLKSQTSSNFVIDIGASDGIGASNTYNLFKSGVPGVAVEPDGKKFSNLAAAYKTFNVN